MTNDPSDPRGDDDPGASDAARDDLPSTAGAGSEAFHLSRCALIADKSEWSDELAHLGVAVYRRPEALYQAIRTGNLILRACLVDLDSIPRNLIRSVDLRVPCPKVWFGRSAANPADVKNFGVYYSRARTDELNRVVARLAETDDSTMLAAGIVARQVLPLLVADDSYREHLHRHAERFADGNLITIQGDDPLELQLVAEYLAVETRRTRIWEIRSDTSFQATLRKISQARRPGTDVCIILSAEIDADSAREFHKSIPAEYALIKLGERSDEPVGSLSLTLPRPQDRPKDIENWAVWFVCRATIEHGIALRSLADVVESILRTVGDNPPIEDIRAVSERSVKQHATMMEENEQYTSYQDLVHNYERTILRQALAQHAGNLSATARSLGLAESSLRYKMKKLGLKNKPSR